MQTPKSVNSIVSRILKTNNEVNHLSSLVLQRWLEKLLITDWRNVQVRTRCIRCKIRCNTNCVVSTVAENRQTTDWLCFAVLTSTVGEGETKGVQLVAAFNSTAPDGTKSCTLDL